MSAPEPKKQVSFSAEEEMGPVETVVERGKEALGMAASSVLARVPGTAEHAVRTCAKELEEGEGGAPVHVADEVAYTKGPASAPSAFAAHAVDPHTVKDIDYTTGEVLKPVSGPHDAPKDTRHVADDLAYLYGAEGQRPPPPERRGIDPHTADGER